MIKLALASLLFATPLVAQTSSPQKIVYNVVVTVVTAGATTTSPNPPPVSTPTPPPTLTPPTPPTPISTPVPPAPPGSVGCVSNYASAASSVSNVSDSLVQAQQLFSAALSQKSISASSFATGSNTLSLVSLDNGDVRDMIRIAGPSDVVAQNIAFVSSEIGTLPGLLGTTTQLSSSLTALVASMQTNLGTATSLVTTSTCPQAVP